MEHTWTRKIQQIHASIKYHHSRNLTYNNEYGHVTRGICLNYGVLPITTRHTKQITAQIVQYLWTGWIFRVPLTTLYKKRPEGGLGMIHIKAKCDALYINRLHKQRHTPDNLWIILHHDLIQKDSPPNWVTIPPTIEHLRIYFQELAYIQDLQQDGFQPPSTAKNI